MQVITASTPISEPALPVMDTDTKKWNCNFCRTPTSRVNCVMEKDIKQKYYESNGEEKQFLKSYECISMMR
jgi:hypothetical protein